jgi:diaphanous 1
VQRLVTKEKQVLQLQTEVDRLKAQNPSDGREAVCIKSFDARQTPDITQEEKIRRDRDRAKWNALNEEIAKLKIKVRFPCFCMP